MGALDELLTTWRANPDAGATIALCSYLGFSAREDVIREIGGSATTWHSTDLEVTLAVGRMYLDAGLLPEAQAALVSAGKLDAADPRAFRFLGEVLLRRGDAQRAEKVLARSIQLGSVDPETRLWQDRATVYSALQRRAGAQAVAAEVARAVPKKPSVPPPAPPELGREPFASEEIPTQPKVPAMRMPPTPALAPSAAFAIAAPPLPSFASAQPGFTPSAPAIAAPVLAPAIEPPSRTAPTLARFVDDAALGADEILEELARVGVYEPGGGAPPAWERAPAVQRRGVWPLVIGTVLVLGAAGGGYAYAQKIKRERMDQATALCAEIDSELHAGSVAALTGTDEKLGRAFALDSRNETAARLWLQNRVLSGVLLPTETRGIDGALVRVRALNLPEEEWIYARVASFLVDGDLAGAAALLPKWDARAGNSAMYQLIAGLALERAGDPRALERYEAAVRIDPKLAIAQALLAQLALLEMGAEKGKPVVDALKAKTGDTAVTRTLSALAWAVDPQHAADPPAEARISDDDRNALPTPFAALPHLVRSVEIMGKGDFAAAGESIDLGIAAASAPAIAARLGFFAVGLGDEEHARKAALRALSFSALYPPARVLAARVALVGGRLDEAKKAIEDLDPRSPEVAVVRAAVAYETLDATALASATEALTAVEHGGLRAAKRVLSGTPVPASELEQIAAPDVVWGEVVAVDAALDVGDLDRADKIVATWGKRADRAVFALRVARLRRYQGKTDDALKASAVAVSAAVTQAALVERVYCFIAADRPKDAADVLAKYPTVLGPMSAWLGALIDAAQNRVADANVKTAQLELVPDAAPLLLRVLSLRALAAAGDRRAKAQVRLMAKALPRHPDVLLAAGAKK